MGRNKSAARVTSSSARSKNSCSPALPFDSPARMLASYAELPLMAWSKIVGFEVSPVTDSSSMYCCKVPLSSRSRVMLSSQRLCPRLWSSWVAFMFVVLSWLTQSCSQAGQRARSPAGRHISLHASIFDVTRFIPQPDHRSREAPFIAQGAQTGGAEHEGPGMDRQLEADPAGGQGPKEMVAGKQQHVSLDRAEPAHSAVSPGGDLGRRFPARAAVAEQVPVGALSADLGRPASLVLAVIPFQEIAIDFGDAPKAGQLACPAGALQGTGKDLGERQSF